MPKLTLKDYKPRTPVRDQGPIVRIQIRAQSRRDRHKYYAKNSDGMFWTEFREVAETFTNSVANQLARRIADKHAELRSRIEIIPV
jgi:hypothetical protein